MKYSDYAIVLTWETINDEPDIGKWNLLFEDDLNEINGIGMSDLMEALLQLNQNQINVIFTKNLNLFEVIGENYFSYSSDFKASVREGQINFYQLKPFEFVELRNWDNFWDDVTEGKEFLRRLTLSRNNFKGNNKNNLSLRTHYNYTIAKEQWFDISEKYFLKKNWSSSFRNALLPQDEREMDLLLRIYKGSYYFTNPKYINKTVNNVKGYDISSSHGGFILREKYPSYGMGRLNGFKEIFDLIDKEWYAWIGEFKFEGLQEKTELPIDLRNFGFKNKNDGSWHLVLTNVHWNTFKRLFKATNVIPLHFFYYEQKELEKRYVMMMNDLYEEKEWYKQKEHNHGDSFVSSIFKFRTELPYGQSIKAPSYTSNVIYDEINNKFIINRISEKSFEENLEVLKKRPLPFQIGIWTAAYSWAEEINMILDIGIDNVIYGDTDCVKFIGDYDKIIEKRNKEIDKKVHKVATSKLVQGEIGNKIGRWKYEGVFKNFKAIGVKWYLFESEKGLEVKAAGANIDKLIEELNHQEKPFEFFNKEMYVDKLFKNVSVSRENGTVFCGFNNYMGDKLKKEINLKTNGFEI